MLGIHINCTKPLKNKDFKMSHYSILVMMLSALMWKKNHGNIKLYTDNKGIDYYNNINVSGIWSDIHVDEFESIDGIDHGVFWAGGKFHALKEEQSDEFCMLDTDMIIWKNLNNKLIKSKILTIHDEDMSKIYLEQNNLKYKIYISKENMELNDNQHKMLTGMDWSVSPSNTAFVYFNDNHFKNTYSNNAIEFMKKSKGKDLIRNIVFIEQRYFSMLAKKLNKNVDYFLKYEDIHKEEKQNIFTHIWGSKGRLNSDIVFRNQFIKNCEDRILYDFPKYKTLIYDLRKRFSKS